MGQVLKKYHFIVVLILRGLIYVREVESMTKGSKDSIRSGAKYLPGSYIQRFHKNESIL